MKTWQASAGAEGAADEGWPRSLCADSSLAGQAGLRQRRLPSAHGTVLPHATVTEPLGKAADLSQQPKPLDSL